MLDFSMFCIKASAFKLPMPKKEKKKKRQIGNPCWVRIDTNAI